MAGKGGRVSSVLLGAAVAAIASMLPAAASAAPVQPCNGHPTLCPRTLDQVVLPGTHNSMSAEELDWNLPNQIYGIPGQLRRGARAFLIDTYYGRPGPTNSGIENVSKGEGSQAGLDLYLCHSSCGGGASALIEVFGEIDRFLDANPREVLVFVNEDYVTADDFAGVVEESGLIEHVYRGPTGPWPTLNEMIASGGRVLFLAQSDAGDVPWYHRAYAGPMRETPYSFSGTLGGLSTELLTAPDRLEDSCRPNRGGNDGGLFLMNHWILGNGLTPLREFAEVVNTRSALVDRARVCERVRGKMPTILAVDFFGIGDETGAALELNGLKPWVAPKPPRRLTAAQIRRKARAACRKKKGRARTVCIRKQTAKLRKQNSGIRA